MDPLIKISYSTEVQCLEKQSSSASSDTIVKFVNIWAAASEALINWNALSQVDGTQGR